MCMSSGGGSTPQATPPPAIVDTTSIASNTDATNALNSARKRAALAKGQQSTISTGALGDTTAAPVAKNTLLGSN